MVGQEYQARCDMDERKARKLYKNLFSNGMCEWAELVGEDDDNYMEVLDSFDHIRLARSLAQIMGEIRGISV